jgi:protein TonB
MPMLEENRQPETDQSPFDARSELKQRRQMLIALALLLAALIVVLYKDWQFWFPSSTATVESEPLEENAPQPPGQSQRPPNPGQTTATARSKLKPRAPEVMTVPNPETVAPIITNRKVLPPLQVEVVAGDQHQTVTPGNPSVKLDLGPRSPAGSETAEPTVPQSGGGVTNAAAQVHLSPGTAEVVSHPVDPNYPMLAKQMKVQGSVVLQALIGKDGNIQDLQVLSGPAILSAAAREAVKQWRFKPYLQAGQPVETEARITVNFTISTY